MVAPVRSMYQRAQPPALHTEPGIPHYPDPRLGRFVLEPGMCFTIEPMINAGV